MTKKNHEICVAGSFSLAAAGEAVGTHRPSFPALPWAEHWGSSNSARSWQQMSRVAQV